MSEPIIFALIPPLCLIHLRLWLICHVRSKAYDAILKIENFSLQIDQLEEMDAAGIVWSILDLRKWTFAQFYPDLARSV